MRNAEFLKNFVFHPNRTGAVAPSSSHLAKLITDAADLEVGQVVLEFGPGTGVFTERILQRLPPDGTFIAFEANPDFARATRERCPEVTVVEDTAARAHEYLKNIGVTHCDRIICGLPWASFDDKLQDQILASIRSILAPGGLFLTFAYVHGVILPAGWRFRRKLRATFPEVGTTRVVWRNLPPAFVYVVRN